MVWGNCVADAVVRIATSTIIPLIAEVIQDGKLVERQTSVRDGGTTQVDHPVTTVEPDAYQSGWTKSWWRDRLGLSQDDEAGVHLAVTYGDTSHRHSALWKELPVWAQAHLLAPYPVCACGRERVDTPSGASVCAQCQREQSMLERIDQDLPRERRVEIARVAAMCHAASEAAQAFEGQAGFDLLCAIMGDEPRASVDWQGYPWYYMTTEGFYASRFPPTTMMILSNFGSAQGQGLVRLAAWLPGEPSLHRCEAVEGSRTDFYGRTQERGLDEEPSFDSWLRDSCVAVKLCGTLAQRLVAVEAVRAHKAQGGDSWEIDQALSRHDYAQVLAKVAELAEGLAGRKRLTDLLASEYGTCPACKGEWYETRRHGKHCECMRDVYPPEAENITLKHTCTLGGQVLVEVVWNASGQVTLVVPVDSIPAHAITQIVWAPTQGELNAWDRLRQARLAADALETERNRAHGDFATRVRLTWDRQLSQGKLFALVGVTNLVISWSDDSTETFTGDVRFVCDPNRCKWLDEQGISRPRPGETWFCSWKRGGFGQTALAIGRDRQGRPILVANPQTPDDPEREARLQREADEAEAAAARAKAEADKARASGGIDLSRLLAKLGQS